MNMNSLCMLLVLLVHHSFKPVRHLPRRPRPPSHHHYPPPAEQDRVALSRFQVLQNACNTPLPSPQHMMGQNRLTALDTKTMSPFEFIITDGYVPSQWNPRISSMLSPPFSDFCFDDLNRLSGRAA